MKKSIKAALLSALVLPGAGHFFLKKQLTGMLLAILAFAGLYSIISTTLERAQRIADKILSGEAPAGISALTEFVSSEAMNTGAQQMDLALLALLISWAFGIIDSYRIGRQLEKGEHS